MYMNPYRCINEGKGTWKKSNFHTHAGTGPNTCGAYDLEEVIKLYKEAGYKALCISNHDVFTDTSHLKEKYDMVLINGYEFSQANHMLCVGCGGSFTGSNQEAIDACVEQGGFVILCHPNWDAEGGNWPLERIKKVRGYTGIEVFNSVIGRMGGTGLAEDVWDSLLSEGKLVWGFGNDDFHRWYDLNKSWTVIYSESNDEDGIKTAIRRGSFYLSTGITLDEMTFCDNIIKIRASESGCYPKDYQYVFIGRDGQVLCRQEEEWGEYRLTGDELYVRVKVIGEQGYTMWTQPIYNEQLFKNC